MTLSDTSLGSGSTVEVPMLGKEGRRADCETVSVESGFRKIKVSLTIGGRFIDGIQFLRDGSVNFDTFGRITAPIETWTFD